LERLGHHIVSRRVALGYRNRTDLAASLQLTVRTLADIEHGVRKASPGTYAMLENKLTWAPGSIDTILAGGEPKELVVELRRPTPSARPQGYALRPMNPNALSQVSTEELLLELRRRVIAPRDTRHDSWDDWDAGLDPHGDWPEEG
ncbi:MAG: helix-turn-helix transcriptional regulator, partial [Mycobacterium sp.]